MNKYEPYEIVDKDLDFDIKLVVNSSEFLKIFLSIRGNNIGQNTIVFDSCLVCRIADEADRLKFLRDCKEDFAKHHIFTVKNSEFINWFVEENLGKYDSTELHHFVIIDPEYVIDVISGSVPYLEEFDNEHIKFIQELK